MLKLTGIAFLAVLLNSRCGSPDSVVGPAVSTPTTSPVMVPTQGPAILEAIADGIGKATITDHTILVKLPADYAKTTIRLTYTVTADVKKITPASGQDIPIRAGQAQTVCIQNDALGNCTFTYQLIIQAVSPLSVTLDPASRQLDVTRYLQPYALTFQLGKLNAQPGVTRQFQVRFVNKTTGYTYVGDNYMVNDKTGTILFINQPGVTLPDEGQLRMTGTLPLDMPTGAYAISVLVPTCYSPTADGRCLSYGTEGIDLADTFVLNPGPPLVGEISPVPTTAGDLVIKGRNFSLASPLPVHLASDFTPAIDAKATVETETIARLPMSATLATGQYRLDVAPAGGLPYSALFSVPGLKGQPAFAYAAILGNYVATQNGLPTFPAFGGGETLEVRYPTGYTMAVKAVHLIDTKVANHTIDLIDNGSFRPYAGVTDFVMWKWTLPASLPKGVYALVFEATDGSLSLPYYQAIRVL